MPPELIVAGLSVKVIETLFFEGVEASASEGATNVNVRTKNPMIAMDCILNEFVFLDTNGTLFTRLVFTSSE